MLPQTNIHLEFFKMIPSPLEFQIPSLKSKLLSLKSYTEHPYLYKPHHTNF